ncbi:MAG: alpha-ketoglutarate-dependent dioxygenase AlkB [Ilumatobacteraceae bacterium]
MSIGLSWQTTLFGDSPPGFDPSFAQVQRTSLDEYSWVDHLPGWLGGSDRVFTDLADALPWRQREVMMWDKRLPEPRLTHWWDGLDGSEAPMPLLLDIRDALTARYHRPFDSIGFNLYRDGRDSVAWHGDRERFTHEQPVVVIVSVGAARNFMLRRRGGGGGASRSFRIGHGDLLVMGGACQHDWEHCVPKVARADGPRLSIMFRHNLAGFSFPGLGARNVKA